MKKYIAVLLTAVLTLLVLLPAGAGAAGNADSEVQDIIGYLLDSTGSSSVQALADGYLTENAGGGAEWFIYSLARLGGCDFSSYIDALRKYNTSGAVLNAAQKEKHALILMSVGAGSSYAAEILDSSAFGLGLMSRIFALHIVNNGYSCGEANADTLINELLSLKKSDGGWAVTGDAADVDCTAMVLQAFAPYYGKRDEVTAAADAAVSLLASRQETDGGFKSYGKENCESTAQVITALTGLGINPDTDERFIKNGKTLTAVLLSYKLADCSYSHEAGGAYSGLATVQALGAFVSLRLSEAGENYYFFNNASPALPQESSTAPAGTTAEVTQSAQTETNTAQPQAEADTAQTDTAHTDSTVAHAEAAPAPSASAEKENKDSRLIIIIIICAAAAIIPAAAVIIVKKKK